MKKILNVMAYKEEKLTCIECALLCAINYFNIESKLLFTGSWNFGYCAEKITNCFWGDIISTNKQELGKYMKYVGVELNKQTSNSFESLLTIVKEEIDKERPVVAYIDSFYCSWNEVYKKYHFKHYCLIIGYDFENKNFICRDTYITNSIVELSFGDYEQGFGECIFFKKVLPPEYKIIKRDLLNDIVNYTKANYERIKMTDRIRQFGEDIVNNLEKVYEEIDYYDDPKFSNLLVELSFISWSRYKMAEMFTYLNAEFEFDINKNIINGLRKTSNMWAGIRALLYKQILIRGEFDKTEFLGCVNQVADIEEDIINIIEEYIT